MPDSTPPRTKIVGISGSLREDSLNTALLRVAAAVAPEEVDLEIADISDLPIYNRDDEAAYGFPAPVTRLRRQVADADGILFATPEYNFSVTGALKNAFDWLSRGPSPLDRAPTAMLSGAGRLGGLRSQEHLRDMTRHNRMQLVESPQVLVTGVSSKFDEQGEFTDRRAADQIRRLMAGLRSKVLESRRYAARVLLVGRHEDRMRHNVGTLKESGHRPVLALTDDEALAALKQRRFEAVLIGGGVEQESRERIAAFADDLDIPVGHTFGPASLLEVLEDTLSGGSSSRVLRSMGNGRIRENPASALVPAADLAVIPGDDPVRHDPNGGVLDREPAEGRLDLLSTEIGEWFVADHRVPARDLGVEAEDRLGIGRQLTMPLDHHSPQFRICDAVLSQDRYAGIATKVDDLLRLGE
jgi:chromate reductase